MLVPRVDLNMLYLWLVLDFPSMYVGDVLSKTTGVSFSSCLAT